MDVKIASDWKEILSEEFEKPYFRELTDFVRQEYASRRIFPRGSNIFVPSTNARSTNSKW